MTDLYDEAHLPLWSDNPAKNDLLGFTDIAAPIAGAIARERLNPVVVGLKGPWGSGKTTVLNLLGATMAPREDEDDDPMRSVLVVVTSPWAYDPQVDVKVTLIGEVLEQIAAYAMRTRPVDASVLKALDGLVKKVNLGKALTLAAKTAVSFQIPGIDDIAGVFNLDKEDGPDPTMNSFRGSFAKALGDLPEVERVVVLVDDLDRCLPDSVVATLEAIKLFLSVEKMAFVVAYDETPVIEAVRTRYENAEDPALLARQYLEKIIQIPVSIPRLGTDEVATYLALTMLDMVLDHEPLGSIVVHAMARRRAGQRPLLDGHGVELRGEAQNRISLANRLAPLLTVWLQGNPRRIKRFINDLWMRSSIANARQAGLSLDALAKLMVLEQVHDDRFRGLVSWAAEGVAEGRLADIEAGRLDRLPDWATPALRLWASTEPPLAGTEIANYLELAATLRAMDFVAPGFSPELQAVLSDLRDAEPVMRKRGHEAAAKLSPEDRVQLATVLIASIPSRRDRRADIAEAIPALVSGDDGVGRAVVTAVKLLKPADVEASLLLRLEQAGVDSINDFLNLVRKDPAYAGATGMLGEG